MLKLEECRMYQDEEGSIWIIVTADDLIAVGAKVGIGSRRVFNAHGTQLIFPNIIREYRAPWFDHYLEAWEKGIVIEKRRAKVASIRVEHILPRLEPEFAHVHASLAVAFDAYGITGRRLSRKST